MVNIKEEVFKLKSEFVRQFSGNTSISSDSIFLIGSCAGKEDDFNDWYQDFDIHLLFNKSFIDFDELNEIGLRFEKIKSLFASDEIISAWKIKDRHWKLIPDNKYKLNLSIHGTVANKFDFYRRIRLNPILGWNMYQLCEPLYGKAPSAYISLNKPTTLDLFHSVGGVSWMMENFYRALWFYFTNPQKQTFYPYIQGYCWNVPSSIMLQYYLAKMGIPGTRKEALTYLLSDEAFPQALKRELDLIIQNKRKSEWNEQMQKDLINASYKVSSWLIRELKSIFGITTPNHKETVLSIESSQTKSIEKVLSSNKKIEELHYYFNFDENDFFNSFQEKLKLIISRYENPSYSELPEFLIDFIDSKREIATKVYFWNDLNILRYNLSHDFHQSKNIKSKDAIFWGWENGTQTFLQRLNELFIQKDITQNIDLVSSLFLAISIDSLKCLEYNNVPKISGTIDIKKAITHLAALNEQYILL